MMFLGTSKHYSAIARFNEVFCILKFSRIELAMHILTKIFIPTLCKPKMTISKHLNMRSQEIQQTCFPPLTCYKLNVNPMWITL